MQHQKAVYLQEMGITRWQVRKPELFACEAGKKNVDLSRYALLILIEEAEFAHPLMGNILKAFQFSPEQVYHCSMAEFEAQQGVLPEYIWSTLGKINQPYGHKVLNSVPVSQLANNPHHKKSLWKQFCAFKK
ncbi:DNA polymerase III subunit psi [Psychromonas sp. MME2]|uniref:DNA polymerase III subunit psi n=1 Tax=unclassified Psychromonas TaxID=2614957 RepID=UPI00339D266F